MKSHKLGPGGRAPWNMQIHQSARQEILDLGAREARRVLEKLKGLAEDPLRPRPGMDILKLKDVARCGLYRLRVGERRVLYAALTLEDEVLVLVVDDREVGYRRLQVRAEERLRDLQAGG